MNLRFTNLKRRNRNKIRPNLQNSRTNAFLKTVPFIIFISDENIEKLSIRFNIQFKILKFLVEQRIINKMYYTNEGGNND